MSLFTPRIIPLTLCAFLLSACQSVNLNMETQPRAVTSKSSEQKTQDNSAPESIYHPYKGAKNLAAPYAQAKQAYDEGNYQQAQSILDDNFLQEPSEQDLNVYILAALVESRLDNPIKALSLLDQANQLPLASHPDNQNRLNETKASVYEYVGNWPEAVKLRMQLFYNLPLGEGANNQAALWGAIQNLTQNEVDELDQADIPLLHGWLEISNILRTQSLTIEQQLAAFHKWQLNNPDHPAAKTPPQDFYIMEQLEDVAPQKIVLMLPMDGKLGRASQAIIDGFFSSYYHQQNKRPQIVVINTNAYKDIVDALNKANEEQPNVIIGPLQKNNVARISQLHLPYPVIALNQLDNVHPEPNLYHFSLNVEDDIHQLISFAKQEGATRAAILSTQDSWALKQSDEFLTAAEQEHVKIKANISYENTSRGRQKAVQELLLVDESNKRKRLIENWIGNQVESTARPRQDLDYIYYVGKLGDAKQIRPLLDFYFADKIPMLSSNTLNDTPPEKGTNFNDIERILFTEIPALTQKKYTLNAIVNTQDSNILRRLQALGADAYLLANRYPLFIQLPSARISANTGIITMDKDGIFHKRPDIVTYRNGSLVNAESNRFFYTEETPE